MTDSLTQSINYEAVCRTAPATPGLLNRVYVVEVLPAIKGTSLHIWVDGLIRADTPCQYSK